ncbi:hypothetical protein FHS83_003812 [Rhizomicrobium palustre]|uniref:Putative auto-transporter adhesin head GIN domain-containing protein n=1 Tax=Rhizomicrobium palustre TaxID=189966 RepID=A0A846N386_9PROT|nr:DUF2807 domain-containing protein [Rhizomicrobium palustre]NIK90494.1 hypothetical protein [Rhizomicrobium palustre]
MIRFAALAATAVLFTSPGLAATELNLPPFSGINVHGGGEVKLVYGPQQRVTVIKSDPKTAEITVVGNTLNLSPCTGMCWGRHDLVVEVTTPRLETLSVHGGGTLTTQGEFPKQQRLRIDVHGGGEADLRGMPVDDISADVHGGGELHVKPIHALNAEVHGGGEVTYVGHPAILNSRTHGGGSVSGE